MATIPKGKRVQTAPRLTRIEQWVKGNAEEQADLAFVKDGQSVITLTIKVNTPEEGADYLRAHGFRFVTGQNQKGEPDVRRHNSMY